MKSIISLVIFLSGYSAVADTCPDISGAYHCVFKTTNPEDLKISQRESQGVMIFTLNGNEAIADGVIHKMSSDDELKNGLYKATCQNGGLQIWQRGDLKFAPGYLEATLKFAFNPSGQLLNESQGKLVVNGKERSLDNLGICTRK